MARIGKSVYVFGGCRRASFLNDLVVLNTETMRWAKPTMRGPMPKARAYHTLTADPDGGALYLFGGNDDQNSMSELHVLNTGEDRWWQPNTSGMAPSARIGAASVFINQGQSSSSPSLSPRPGGRLILFGGWDYSDKSKDSYFNDVHVLDTSSWHWSVPPSPVLAPSARAGMQMALATDRSCVVFGGRDEDENFVEDTW